MDKHVSIFEPDVESRVTRENGGVKRLCELKGKREIGEKVHLTYLSTSVYPILKKLVSQTLQQHLDIFSPFFNAFCGPEDQDKQTVDHQIVT